MEIRVTQADPEGLECDVLALPVCDTAEMGAAVERLDGMLAGRLRALAESGELEADRGSLTALHTLGHLPADRVALAGVGSRVGVDADALRTAAARVVERAGRLGGQTVAWVLDTSLPIAPEAQARAIVDGTVLAGHEQGRWKTSDRVSHAPSTLVLLGPTSVEEEARSQEVAARWTNRARELVDAPPNELTPVAMAAFAEEIAASLPHIRCEWLDRDAIRSAGMGALLAVASGAANEPRLVVLEYEPPGAASPSPHLGLVGKAITFDSGGLSLKPAASMSEMKDDMAGGAAALCGLAALAELGVALRVTAVVPACENMPDGSAFRPSDILTASNGKTIEITNTDAEGRLVLADALVEARRRGATHLLDLATLTGGATVALGDFYAALMGRDEEWVTAVRDAGLRSGDHVWQLPLHDTYRRQLRSSYADMKNSSEWRQAVPIYAAMFLGEFAGDGPWAHLDIAGTASLPRGRGDYYSKAGATGFGVRLIADLGAGLTG